MSQIEVQKNLFTKMYTLHARTHTLMKRFNKGYECPKLAHLIACQLGQLLTYAELLQITTRQETYSKLLEDWQLTTNQLLLERPL